MRLPSGLHSLLGLALVATLAACGGHPPAGDEGGPDGGSDGGGACQFDTDCSPPNSICGTDGICTPGCTAGAQCPAGKVCNTGTGRCVLATNNPPDGGTDGGSSDAGPGTPSASLCKACTDGAQCVDGNGLCVSNRDHTATFCTQDCTNSPCPTGYDCTTDRTGTKKQCYPTLGTCPGLGGGDGGTDGGGDGGTPYDPTQPSDNPSGCGFCGACTVNNDCVTGSVCANGSCATGPCNGWFDCVLTGAILATCTDVGLPQKYCLPLLGACLPLPGPLAPLAGDIECVPSGTNPACATPAIPAPSMGQNFSVTQNLSPKPALATEDHLTIDSQGRIALGYIGADSSGGSYMGVSQSLDDGKTWIDRGRMQSTTSYQSDPVLVTTKFTEGGVAKERMHYVWIGYDLSGQGEPRDMFVEYSKSDDGGATWSAGSKVTTTVDNNNGVLLVDKPWIAAAPDGTLIVTYSIGDNSQQHLYASVSTDNGNSWKTKVAIENGANDHGHNLAMPVFDPADSNKVYIAYVRYTQIEAGTSNSIQLVWSNDKGATWQGPTTVSASDDQVLFEPPSIAMDKNKHVYVGYVASRPDAGPQAAKYWDAMVALVDLSTGTPQVARRTKANDEQGGCFQHFHSMVQVDNATGKVFVAWLDNRNGGKGGLYYATSTDQGATWSSNRRVSDADFTFNPDHWTARMNFLGDYFGLLWDGTKLRFAWSDPRNGTEAQVFYAHGVP